MWRNECREKSKYGHAAPRSWILKIADHGCQFFDAATFQEEGIGTCLHCICLIFGIHGEGNNPDLGPFCLDDLCRFQSAHEMLQAIEVSTRAPVILPPTRGQKLRAAISNHVHKMASFTGSALKHTLLLPIYIAVLPFILGYYAIHYRQ